VATLVAYTDESEQSNVLCVAAYIGYAKEWGRFTKQWRKQLRKKDIEFFHMKDFMDSRSDLRRKLGSPKEALEFYEVLTGLIRKYTCKSFRFVIDQAEYKRFTTHKFRSQYGSAYTFLNKAIISYCRQWAIRTGYKHLTQFFVEDGHRNCEQVRPYLSRLCKTGVIGSSGIGNKRSEIPLQAADILAYLTTNGYVGDCSIPTGRLPKVSELYFDKTLILEQVERIQEAWKQANTLKQEQWRQRKMKISKV